MDWARRQFGLTVVSTDAVSPSNPPSPIDNAQMERERLLKKDMLDLKKLRVLAANAHKEAERYAAEQRPAQAKQKLIEKKKHLADAAVIENKINNQKAIEQSISTAQSNKKHVELMADGADQLKKAVKETEAIHIDTIVDDLKEGIRMTEEHSSRLSEPLFASSLSVDDDDQIDDELNALMEKTYDLPAVPVNNVVGGNSGGKPEHVRVPMKQPI